MLACEILSAFEVIDNGKEAHVMRLLYAESQLAADPVVGITYPEVKESTPVAGVNVSPVVVEEIALRALASVK